MDVTPLLGIASFDCACDPVSSLQYLCALSSLGDRRWCNLAMALRLIAAIDAEPSLDPCTSVCANSPSTLS